MGCILSSVFHTIILPVYVLCIVCFQGLDLSFLLGADYERKKQKLQQELQLDYKQYVAKVWWCCIWKLTNYSKMLPPCCILLTHHHFCLYSSSRKWNVKLVTFIHNLRVSPYWFMTSYPSRFVSVCFSVPGWVLEWACVFVCFCMTKQEVGNSQWPLKWDFFPWHDVTCSQQH